MMKLNRYNMSAIKTICKKMLIRTPRLMWFLFATKRKIEIHLHRNSLIIECKGIAKLRKYIKGTNNNLIIEQGCILNNVSIHIIGNNNLIKFNRNVHVGPQCSFWIEGNNCSIIIGENTTFTKKVHFNAQEDKSEIICGKDCMFSNTIIVRTSDSHAIIDMNTHKRINPAKNVTIGEHVWIAPSSTIMKGVHIGSNTIIGSHTLVTKDIPSNVLAVGMPAKIVKEGITWSREDIIFKNKHLYNE